MRRLEEAGLEALGRLAGYQRAEEIAGVYRDVVLPRAEALTYRLSPLGRASRRKLTGIGGRHNGQRCFILGNGPSINATEISLLRDEVTFALNRGYLLFDRLGGPATYLVAVNRHVIEQFAADLVASGSQVIAGWRSRQQFSDPTQVTFIRRAPRSTFSIDVAVQGASEGPTVTYLALQLAFYMGFSEVVLVGVDHSFATLGPPNKLVTSRGNDPNHFDPNYFGPGVRWQLPDLKGSEEAFLRAREAYSVHNRRIIDATVGGKLMVFPKADLASILSPRTS